MPSLHESLERASAPLIATLSRLPRVVSFLVVLALMVLGIVISGWGWVFLAVVALFLLWLLLLFWPGLTRPERLLRVAVVALVVALTVVRAFPRG